MSIVSKFPKKDKKKKNREWSENLLILPVILFIMLLVLAVAMFVNLEDVEEKEVPELKAEPIKVVVEVPELVIKEEEPEEFTRIHITDDDILAAVAMSEAGNQDLLGKAFVVLTVLNRADHYGKTIETVVNEPNQYSYPYYGVVTHECYTAVELARAYRDIAPDIMWFRTGKYHTFGEPAFQWGDHYFSKLEREDKQ